MRVVFLWACVLLAAFEVWAVFVRRAPAVAIEGQHPRVVQLTANGPAVLQMFEMTAGGITAIDLRVSTDQPATVLLRCRLSDVTETTPGIEEPMLLRHRSAAPTQVTTSWFVTMKHVSGTEWRRVAVPDGRAFVPGIYELWLQLVDVHVDRRDRNPASAGSPVRAGLVASVDNVLGGGSLWIGDQRQLGSLSIRVYSQARNAFAQFRADTASDLSGVLASAAVMIGIAVVYQASLVAVVYMLTIGRRERCESF
jgi:hypothetical protein